MIIPTSILISRWLFFWNEYNTTGTPLEGRLTNKRRIEYQFKFYGGVTVELIEVKTEIGGFNGHLNCIAHVIAEFDIGSKGL